MHEHNLYNLCVLIKIVRIKNLNVCLNNTHKHPYQLEVYYYFSLSTKALFMQTQKQCVLEHIIRMNTLVHKYFLLSQTIYYQTRNRNKEQ